MEFMPKEIIKEISIYLPLEYERNLSITNKNFYNLLNKQVLKKRKNAIKIFRRWRNLITKNIPRQFRDNNINNNNNNTYKQMNYFRNVYRDVPDWLTNLITKYMTSISKYIKLYDPQRKNFIGYGVFLFNICICMNLPIDKVSTTSLIFPFKSEEKFEYHYNFFKKCNSDLWWCPIFHCSDFPKTKEEYKEKLIELGVLF